MNATSRQPAGAQTCLLALCLLSGTAAASRSADIEQLACTLGDVPASSGYRYHATDDRHQPLDCLNVCQTTDGRILGVYHYARDGVLRLALAESRDGLQWRHLGELDEHASQGQLVPTANGELLLACEKDAPNSCWIRVSQFAGLDELLQRAPERSLDIARSLAPTAEGTPMIDRGRDANDQEEIDLRFHYYEDARVDRLARGQLVGFDRWSAARDSELNRQFSALGARGNFGSRDLVDAAGDTWCLQEIQLAPGDWAAWRVYLCNRRGEPLARLPIRTHGGSRSFANPHAESIELASGERAIVVSLFLPHEGAAEGEAGELVYLVGDVEATQE